MTDVNSLSKKDLLKPENMIFLYSQGAFPMADERGEINWYMPEIRTVIPLTQFKIPRSLKKFLSATSFEFSYDAETIRVVEECSKRESTWITGELIEAYKGLKLMGHLHSVEVMQSGKLVGGLYGVTYKGAFFGESMFSKVSQASKCALVKLIERLNDKGYVVLDVQYQTEHLRMFGAVEISFQKYKHLLENAYKKEPVFS
jgi:leucyl/phenylalanyl-tRNA--protein transferase